jgi:hypothetical protein
MFLPQCKGKVSHPYRTTGTVIVLYVLIVMFSESREEEKVLD